MSNVVFILGAGASKQCGAPLIADFLDVANNLLRSNSVPENKKNEFERVFGAIGELQSVHSKAQLDLTNIESIFTVLELGRVIQRVPGLNREEIDEAIASLKELIVTTLEMTMRFPADRHSIGLPKPYDAFSDLLKHLHNEAFPRQTVSVITFNYDIAADMAIHWSDMGPDYCIEETSGHHTKVPLLKLHGSLNWAKDKNSGSIRPLHLSSYFQHYRYNGGKDHVEINLLIGSHLVEYFKQHESCEVENEPVIVPPSWNKADYHSALSDVWAEAAKHLSEAEQLFILGYSLPETDSFFRHLYALGSVGPSPLRRIAVYNPDDSGATRDRFEALLGPGAKGRFEYHPQTFDQAIPHIKKLFPKRN